MNQINKEDLLHIVSSNPRKCMKCGKCSATCPAFEEMEYHPHQFVSMINKGNIEPLLESKSLYYCLSCLACVERCPREVEPAKLIEALRVMKIREKGANHLYPSQIVEYLDEDMPQQALVSAFRKYTR